MNQKLYVITIISYLIIIVVASTYPDPAESEIEIVYSSALYKMKYKSIKQLTNDKQVDLIISGKILSEEAYKKYSTSGSGHGLVHTNFTVKVNAILSGDTEGETVQVHRTGGLINNKLYLQEEDPLPIIGDRCILFLHEFEPGNYFVVGGPQGRFPIMNGRIYSLGEVIKEKYVISMTANLKTNGVTLKTFESMMKESP